MLYGGAGTGKSFVARGLIKAANCLRAKNNIRAHRTKVLVVSSINKNADDLAQNIIDDLKPISEGIFEPVVVRCFNSTIEKQLSRLRENNNSQPARDDYAELVAAKSLHDHIDAIERGTVNGINDKRVTIANQRRSLGYVILRVIGWTSRGNVIDPLCPVDYERRFNQLRIYLRKYADGEKLTAEEEDGFGNEFREAREYVLREVVDILITTCSNAQNEYIHAFFKPHLVFADEVTRNPESNTVGLLYYFDASLTVFLGDHCQIGPVTKGKRSESRFTDQTKRPAFIRFILNGYPQVRLRTQHRSAPMITALLSSIAYGPLDTPAGMLQRPEVQDANVLFRQSFGIHAEQNSMNVVFLETATHGPRFTPSKSQFNPELIKATMAVLKKLLENGAPANEIMIITPYHAQLQLYRNAMRVLAKEIKDSDDRPIATDYVQLAALEMLTVDDVQGGQASYVIVDLVVCQSLGFMKVNQRIIVALSRPRWGLIIVGNYEDMKNWYLQENKHDQFYRTYVHKLVMFCKQKRVFLNHNKEDNLMVIDTFLAEMDELIMHPELPPKETGQKKKTNKRGGKTIDSPLDPRLLELMPSVDALGLKLISGPAKIPNHPVTVQGGAAAGPSTTTDGDGGFQIGDTDMDREPPYVARPIEVEPTELAGSERGDNSGPMSDSPPGNGSSSTNGSALGDGEGFESPSDQSVDGADQAGFPEDQDIDNNDGFGVPSDPSEHEPEHTYDPDQFDS